MKFDHPHPTSSTLNLIHVLPSSDVAVLALETGTLLVPFLKFSTLLRILTSRIIILMYRLICRSVFLFVPQMSWILSQVLCR